MKASANNNNNGGNAASNTPVAAPATSSVPSSQPNNSQKTRQQQRSQQQQIEVANVGASDADTSSKWQHDKFEEMISQSTALTASQTSSSGNGNGSSQSKGSKHNGTTYYNFKQDHYSTSGQQQDAYDQSQSQSNSGANADQGASSASDTSSNNNNGGASSTYGSQYLVNNGNGQYHYSNGYNNKRAQNNGMQNNGYKKSTYGMGGSYQRDDNSGYYQGSNSGYNNMSSRYHQTDKKPMQTGGVSGNYGNGMNGGMRSSNVQRQTIMIYNKEASGYQSTTKTYTSMSGNNNYGSRYYENGSSMTSSRGGGGHIKTYQNQGYGSQYNQPPYDQQRRKSFKDNQQQPYSSGKRQNQNHYYDDTGSYDYNEYKNNNGEVYSPTSQYENNVKESEDDQASSEVDQDETVQETADQAKTKVDDTNVQEESKQQNEKQEQLQQKSVEDINKPKLIYSLSLKIKNQVQPIAIEIHENESIQEIVKTMSSTFDIPSELQEALQTYIARKLEGIIPNQSDNNSDNSNSKKGSEIKVQSSVYNKQQIPSVNTMTQYFQQTPQSFALSQFGHGDDLMNKSVAINLPLLYNAMSLQFQQCDPSSFNLKGSQTFYPTSQFPQTFPQMLALNAEFIPTSAAHNQVFVPQQTSGANSGGGSLIKAANAPPFIYQQPQQTLVSTNGNSSDQS